VEFEVTFQELPAAAALSGLNQTISKIFQLQLRLPKTLRPESRIIVAGTQAAHRLVSGDGEAHMSGRLPTLSSPNWESIIGGAPPELHGITSNGYLRHMVEFEPVCQDRDGKFPTIFGVLRQQQPHSRIAIFHDWRGFADLVERRAPHRRSRKRHAARPLGAAVNRYAEDRGDPY
jgi:hypothetical protein